MSNELYHSDVYLGNDFSDGIRHWKYIKREMKNGRWVYYYKDAALNKAKSNEKIMRKKYNVASKRVDTAFNKENEAGGKLLKSKLDYVFNKDKFIKGKISKKRLDKTTKSYDAAVSERKKAVAERSAAGDKYHRATVNTKSVEQKDKVRKALAKGAIKVANAVSETDYKIKKKVANGKKAVKKALKKAFPESHTSKLYSGDKVTTTKYVNGKQVSKTTKKNKLTEKVNNRLKREEKIKKKVANGKKQVRRRLKKVHKKIYNGKYSLENHSYSKFKYK